jgi:hypothetical protein
VIASVLPPVQGAFRVHPAPDVLPLRPRVGEIGRNRFDDPLGEFRVRYVANTLRGCMVELLARWQEDQDAEEALAAVEGLEEFADENLPDPSKVDGVREWMNKQRVARCLIDHRATFINIDESSLLVELDKHSLVRDALRNSPLSSADYAAHLDFAVIKLGGPVGRPITQAVSRALRDWHPEIGGLAYESRIDRSERCWAIYEETTVRFAESEPLSPDNPVRAVVSGYPSASRRGAFRRRLARSRTS